MPSQGRSLARDKFFETLDEPEHTLTFGGINGEATVTGVPGTVQGRHDTRLETQRYGLHGEPVVVYLRDAVTIDTAVRLTGISRLTLQRAAHDGRLPHLKLGPDNAPYLVRLRDVIVYLTTMWVDKRARKELTDDNHYLGFPEWLVNHISDSWPDRAAFKPGKWQGGYVKINRGGNAPGVNHSDPNRPGYSRKGNRIGRKPRGGWPEEQKKEAPGSPPAPPEPQPEHPEPAATNGEAQSTPDRTKLPKWHPDWQRPPSA